MDTCDAPTPGPARDDVGAPPRGPSPRVVLALALAVLASAVAVVAAAAVGGLSHELDRATAARHVTATFWALRHDPDRSAAAAAAGGGRGMGVAQALDAVSGVDVSTGTPSRFGRSGSATVTVGTRLAGGSLAGAVALCDVAAAAVADGAGLAAWPVLVLSHHGVVLASGTAATGCAPAGDPAACPTRASRAA